MTSEGKAASTQRSEGTVHQEAVTAEDSRVRFSLGRKGREEQDELRKDVITILAGSMDTQSSLGFILGMMCHELRVGDAQMGTL